MRWLLLVCAACTKTQAPAPAAPAPPTTTEVRKLPAGPATATVVLQPGVATPVVDGPFLVTTINPGSSMELGIATSHACANVTWFGYSGGGVAVGAGETLCAVSHSDHAIANGFSGSDGSITPRP